MTQREKVQLAVKWACRQQEVLLSTTKTQYNEVLASIIIKDTIDLKHFSLSEENRWHLEYLFSLTWCLKADKEYIPSKYLTMQAFLFGECSGGVAQKQMWLQHANKNIDWILSWQEIEGIDEGKMMQTAVLSACSASVCSPSLLLYSHLSRSSERL